MKLFFTSCLLGVLATGSHAATVTARGEAALLRGLDKVSGQTTDITLAVGDTVSFGRLQVHLAECRFPANDPSSDAFAELTIDDRSTNKTVFSGWMIASSPALSALDDGRYDIWVISCSKTAAAGKSAENGAGDSPSE